ncbi:NADH-quinone oxidoreductase subunit L [Nocardioides mesophilus]|uniref:NADH-quinone oxidoreductase subunit L n=1 Tax=Nocardioides mesophilus TaxID=433659 RepID=A0A7G9R6U1_9ACTN|nr:NADH-quinone oxidoreductase subunit L [Nocardioides mesophilus]QNN51316.1 NADH-quinone oxidoreductase subunit L [Nocardioides mesophilus]
MSWAVLAVLLVPFVAAVLTLLVGHSSETLSRGIAVGGSALGLGIAVVVAGAHLGAAAPLVHSFVSTDAIGQPVSLAVQVDPLAALLLLLAGIVAFLVQVYSLGYLAEDPRYPSYAALVAVFTGAMSTVVVADDLWMLLVGWELMGACSYFLISHHWELADARAGAVKAFLITRTADLGLLFAILVLGDRFGTYRITGVLDQITAAALPRDELWLPALLVAVAVMGKSAQFPFHTWLPDAMPGPTPISALIHAATMVAAGVFLVARMYPLFLSAPAGLTLLGLTAAFTMLLAALYALVTDDLKRVLAWSTVSQLAYMFGALAVGAWSAAVLHLLAHGAFKALLFLSAGSVVHAVGSTSMERMGGLREKLPDTFVAMTLGFGALAGVVPLVGFFTKDAVIGGVIEELRDGRLVWPWVGWLLLVSMVLTAMLTMAYSLRAWLLVFFGPEQPAALAGQTAERSPVHEPPASMRVPLYLLLVPTVLGGLVVVDPAALLGPTHDEVLVHGEESLVISVLLALTAVVVLWLRQRRGRQPWRHLAVPHPPVDQIWDRGIVRPVRTMARVVRAGDRDVVEAYADGAGASARGLGWLLRLGQNGNVQSYVMVLVVGAAAVAVLAGVAG